MCFNPFKKKKLPHPQEPADYIQTMETANIDATLTKWLENWDVPKEYDGHWLNAIEIRLTMEIPYPASTYELNGVRHLDVRPEWLNPGVIAHEQAHNSYALLSDSQKAAFRDAYMPLISTDPMIKLLYSQNTYGLTSVIEAHAECYRYLGQSLPESLKCFYPRLF